MSRQFLTNPEKALRLTNPEKALQKNTQRMPLLNPLNCRQKISQATWLKSYFETG